MSSSGVAMVGDLEPPCGSFPTSTRSSVSSPPPGLGPAGPSSFSTPLHGLGPQGPSHAGAPDTRSPRDLADNTNNTEDFGYVGDDAGLVENCNSSLSRHDNYYYDETANSSSRSSGSRSSSMSSNKKHGFRSGHARHQGLAQEPRLKYERLSQGEIKNVLGNADDMVTCIAVHPKFLVIGTKLGRLNLLDALGHPMPKAQFNVHSHRSEVSQISIDHDGEFIASCSANDGVVKVSGLYTDDSNLSVNLGKALKAVALDPLFARPGYGKRFLTGDSRVIMHEKTYFSRYKQTILSLSPSDGPIEHIKWRGRFAAWICRKGVVVYDVVANRVISIVKSESATTLPAPKCALPPAKARFPDAAFPLRISWSDQFSLFVAQGSSVKCCSIQKRRESKEVLRQKDLPEFHAEITKSFKLDQDTDHDQEDRDTSLDQDSSRRIVAGIAPMDKRTIVLLTLPMMVDSIGHPELMVVEPLEDDFNEVSVDQLVVVKTLPETASIPGSPAAIHSRVSDMKYFNLECLLEDKHYYALMSSMKRTEIVVGKPRDVDDRVDWLLDKGNFAEALAAAEGNHRMLRRHNPVDVGSLYLDNLLSNQSHYQEAAELCVRIFKDDRKLWQEEAVVKFSRLGQLAILANYLPVPAGPGMPQTGGLSGQGGFVRSQTRLENRIYQAVLLALCKKNKEGLLQAIKEWPPTLYDPSAVSCAVVEELLVDPEDQSLQHSLASLFSHQGKYDKSMALYLKLGHKDVFQLIRRHNLFDAIHQKICALADLDEKEAIKLFLEHRDRLPSELIVRSLDGTGRERQLFLYLDVLCTRKDLEEGKKYHGRLVGLYADYAPQNLLSFLKRSTRYPMQEALEVCEAHGLVNERIYILARMGHTREALELITTELADIHHAVDFCKEYDDPDLWNDLIEYSIDKPLFVNVLLHSIGTHVDPHILIRRIEKGKEIPGLRNSLSAIMQDYHLQVSLQEGCKNIMVFDCFTLLDRQEKLQVAGVGIDEETKCGGCTVQLIAEGRVEVGTANGTACKKRGALQGSSGGSPGSAGLKNGSLDSVDSDRQDLAVFMCHHVYHAECLPIDENGNLCILCTEKKPFADAE